MKENKIGKKMRRIIANNKDRSFELCPKKRNKNLSKVNLFSDQLFQTVYELLLRK